MTEQSQITIEQPTGTDEPTPYPPLGHTAQVARTSPTITVEGAAYLVLGLLVAGAFLLRLGIVPLTTDEVPRALAAWQAVNGNAEPTALADSALLQLGHMFVLSALGNSEAVVRVPTALVGILLVFSPLLFRRVLGPAQTFITCLLLAASPVVIASARLDSPVVWEVALAVIGLWAIWRYTETEQVRFAVGGTVALAGAVVAAGPTGHVIVLILLAACALTERLTPLEAEPEGLTFTAAVRGWPWAAGLGLASLVVLVTSTLMMAYPTGLNAVGQAVGSGFAGWIRPAPNAPAFFALSASLLYEPVLWAFGAAAVVMTFKRDRPTTADLFLCAWAGVAVLVSALYTGATAANALWLTLPLAGLTSGVLVTLLQDEDGILWYNDADRMSNLFGVSVPGWARWAVAGVSAGLTLLLLMHIGELSRQAQVTPLAGNWSNALELLAPSALIVLILILLFVFTAFTAASIWGMGATLRGAAVGMVAVGIVAMLGTGWQVAINRADDPRELWHTTAYGPDVFILRDTLLDLANRETGGFTELEVVVVTDGEQVTDGGMVAWLLRDFDNTTYVRHPSDARAQEIVLAPRTEDPPELGGNYLGQEFTLRRAWFSDALTAREVPVWLFQRTSRIPPSAADTVVLWLRQDVYEGVEISGLR